MALSHGSSSAVSHHREVPAEIGIVDVAHLAAAEGQGPVLGVDPDPREIWLAW